MPGLIENGPVVLQKKFFFCERLSIFFILFLNYLPFGKGVLCAKFGWNWPSGSGEEDENEKSLQTDGQTDRQTDSRRTTGDQKSSLELSAQMS